eukprot:scaffold101190_cov58-Cyclotella_meneghiniana.AAC.3
MESHLTTLTNQHPTIDTVTPATTITAAANDTIARLLLTLALSQNPTPTSNAASNIVRDVSGRRWSSQRHCETVLFLLQLKH